MTSGTGIIRRIEIKRFRSFDNVTIETDSLNIFSGKNNAGKSNVLRALNLFFNNCSNYNVPFKHANDYNKAFRGDAGGKRDIQITVHFHPTGTGALRYNFSIVKTFSDGKSLPNIEYRSENPEIREKINAGDGNVARQFTTFLNKIEYLYIPAVRDRTLIHSLLLRFEQIIKSDTTNAEGFDGAVQSLSTILNNASSGISKEFESYMGLPALATLSANVTDVLGAIEINVKSGAQIRNKRKNGAKGEVKNIPINLFSSGDGVIMTYLVYFLSYLTQKNSKKVIWGFEEPENSLEYSKVQKLAEQFYGTFTKQAQIFITTHSPAFIKLHEYDNILLYRVYTLPQSRQDSLAGLPDRKPTYVTKIDDIPRQMTLFKNNPDALDTLEQELFLAEQSKEIEEAAHRVTAREQELIETQRDFEEKYKGLFPDNVFICEDSANYIIYFWKRMLVKIGLDEKNTLIISSDGCTQDKVEDWLVGQKRCNSDYLPRVFREIDRDGLSKEQLELLAERKTNKFSGHFKYKYCALPVNEIENFALLSVDDPDSIVDACDTNVACSEFFKTTGNKINTASRFFGYSSKQFPSGNGQDGLDMIVSLKDDAMQNPTYFMPGKTILGEAKSKELLLDLTGLDFEELPTPLREYLLEIKEFFSK
jgi:AAA15 family ATPase/GTPase